MAYGFSLTIPQQKDVYKNGNILLYLLDEGPRSEWWQITVKPSNNRILEGIAEKVPVDGDIQGRPTLQEATRALKGCFLQAQNIQFIAAPIIRINWTPVMKRNVGFTLRGIGFAKYANIDGTVNIEGRDCRIITSDVIQERRVNCVYGLVSLISAREIDVVAVAQALKNRYGFQGLRFLFHVYDPQGWSNWFSFTRPI